MKKEKCKRKHLCSFPVHLGVPFILAASLFILEGCASTETGPMSMAHKIHSMTPCGMMMETMMGNGHGNHSGDDVHHQVESYMDSHPDHAETGVD